MCPGASREVHTLAHTPNSKSRNQQISTSTLITSGPSITKWSPFYRQPPKRHGPCKRSTPSSRDLTTCIVKREGWKTLSGHPLCSGYPFREGRTQRPVNAVDSNVLHPCWLMLTLRSVHMNRQPPGFTLRGWLLSDPLSPWKMRAIHCLPWSQNHVTTSQSILLSRQH